MLPEFIENLKQIFCRTRRKEKLKIICQNLIRNLGNEYLENKTDGTSTCNENLNETIDCIEEEIPEENLENCAEQVKDIGGYLLRKAISNAKALNDMKIDTDNNDGIMSNNTQTVYHYSSHDPDGLNDIYAVPVKEANDRSECNLQNSIQLTVDDKLYSDKIEYAFNTSLQESQFFHLKEEIDFESQRIKEISKLFDTFRANIAFYGSSAHLEAEKLMLFGCYRRNYLIECIRDNHYEDTNKNPAIVGSMNLSDFRIPLRRHVSNNFNEWFVCIVSCSNEIFISEPVNAELNWMRFEEMFYFHNICWDSVIDVNVYSMRVPKYSTLKKLLNKNTNKRQSKKLLYKDLRTYDMIECKVNNSMFKLCATGRVYTQERNPSEIKLDVSELYDLEDKMFIRVQFDKLRFINNYSGFLTIGNEFDGAFVWSRKWCLLHGSTFQYWNYPNDEAFKEPLCKIDLKEFARIRLADRSKCPKIRTFILEMEENLYYFSADTSHDLNNWTNALKEVVSCLKGWNVC